MAIGCRIHVIIAREEPLAAVFRRGPSKAVQLLRWNLRTDKVDPGQWLRGRVYERRCDLSPDGRYLIYFAQNFAKTETTGGSYTAISRMPYWTALALWKKGDCWNGGGLFLSNDSLYVNQETAESQIINISPGVAKRLKLLDRHPLADFRGNNECLGIYYPRIVRDGWRLVSEGSTGPRSHFTTFERSCPAQPEVLLVKYAYATWGDREPGRGCYYDEHELRDTAGSDVPDLKSAEWADWDHHRKSASLLIARAGRLYRLRRTGRGNWMESLVLDLNANQFEAIASPPAMKRW